MNYDILLGVILGCILAMLIYLLANQLRQVIRLNKEIEHEKAMSLKKDNVHTERKRIDISNLKI